MSDFSVFMAGNAQKIGTVKYVASKRFGAKNKPVEWELKAIDSDLDEAIRKECTKKVPVAGKRGQYTQETDTDKYTAKAKVSYMGETEEIDIKITYNDDTVTVEVEK